MRIKALTSRARIFILVVIAAGLVISALSLRPLPLEQPVLLFVLAIVTSVTSVLKVEGPTKRSNYQISFMVYGFTMALLGTSAALFVILISYIVEWVWYRYPWYIQMFNVGNLTLSMWAAGSVYTLINPEKSLSWAMATGGLLAAMLIFTFVNHIFVGLVLKLARGESFAESEVFVRLNLMIDFSLFGMGAAAAVIWHMNPFAIVLVVIPLYLIYGTLKVPALQRQANLDPKTGLFNARFFAQTLESELNRADRFDRPLTMVMGDLDLLRNINNVYGHIAGDAVLITLAKILRRGVREYDVVARFGGEEFSILMPETKPEFALARIEELRREIKATEIQVPTSVEPLKVTMSCGIAGRMLTDTTPNELVHQADLALYKAKEEGRNRTYIYSHLGEHEPAARYEIKVPEIENRIEAADISFEPSALRAQPAPTDTELTPTPNTELISTPSSRQRADRTTNLYVTVLTLLASVAVGLSIYTNPSVDWIGLAVFAAIVFTVEVLSIDIYVNDNSVSTSAAPLIAGYLLFGPVGVLLLALTVATATMLKHRSQISRFFFNASNHIVSGFLSLGAISLTGRLFTDWPLTIQTVLTLLAASVVYLSTTTLLAVVIQISTKLPFRNVWNDRFKWLLASYLGMGLVAYGLILSFGFAGLIGVAGVVVPLLLLRFAQVQFVEHTQEVVSRYREANAELEKHSDEISLINEELLLVLAHVNDIRDPFVLNHSVNVARYATLIAEEMALPAPQIKLVRKAGLLHDIGKLGIPEAILFKPDTLTEAEYNKVKQHAAMGADILGISHTLQALMPIVRHHHERFDDGGHPDGLGGRDIPLEARILSIADTVEAMASDRPYRSGTSAPEILEEISGEAGHQFDPSVVAAFRRMLQRHGDTVIINSARDMAQHITGELPSLPGVDLDLVDSLLYYARNSIVH